MNAMGFQRAAHAVAGLVAGGFFLLAAASKANAPDRFAMIVQHVLQGFGLALPALVIAIVMIGLEAATGACLCLRVGRPYAHRTAAVLLCGFVMLLGWMWFHPPRAGCGCITFWMVPENPRDEVIWGVARDVGLLACLGASWPAPVPKERPTEIRVARSGRKRRSGFTLVEALITITIISIIIAVLIPSLSNARRHSRRVAEMAYAQSLYPALSMYGQDYREQFPFFGVPGDLGGPLTVAGQQINTMFFSGQSRLFMNLLYPNYLASTAQLTLDDPTNNSETGYPVGVVRSTAWLTYTAFSRPGYWQGVVPPADTSLIDAGRWSDIAYPSEKGLLLETRAHNRRLHDQEPGPLFPWSIVWGDGSAKLRSVDLDAAYRVLDRPSAMFAWPVLATDGGLAGRDFETP